VATAFTSAFLMALTLFLFTIFAAFVIIMPTFTRVDGTGIGLMEAASRTLLLLASSC
jgi:hypothetical protein